MWPCLPTIFFQPVIKMFTLRSLVKKFILLAYPFFWIKSLFESKCCPKVRVIILHDIRDSWLSPMHRFFEAIRKDFDFITPQQFMEYMNGEFKLKRNSILVTFDDGFKSSKLATDKCLAPYNIKALFFACSDFLNLNDTDGKKFTADKIYAGAMAPEQIGDFQLPMSTQDMKELLAQGHMIGSHSSGHAWLSKVADHATLEYEIISSANKLEQMLNTKISALAWPFGSLDSISTEALKVIKQRYQWCFSGIRGTNVPKQSDFIIFRECIDIDNTLLFNKFICHGGLSLFYKGQRKILHEMLTKDAS